MKAAQLDKKIDWCERAAELLLHPSATEKDDRLVCLVRDTLAEDLLTLAGVREQLSGGDEMSVRLDALFSRGVKAVENLRPKEGK